MAILNEFSLKTNKTEKPTIKDLFKNRSYMILFAGQITFLLANVFAYMTFNYLIYEITKNASLMGLMGVISVLSTIIIVNFAGVIVDRYNQKKIMFISTVVRACTLLGYLICYLLKDYLIRFTVNSITTNNGNSIIIGSLNYRNFISIMYTLFFFAGSASTFLNIAVNAYSKYIIEKKNLLIANSFNSSINQIASVIAPLIVGVLITVSYLYSFTV